MAVTTGTPASSAARQTAAQASPKRPALKAGPARRRSGENSSNQRDGLGGAGFLVFGEKTISREDGSDNFGVLIQDFIEQYAGADRAGPAGYGMIAHLLAPDACEELVQVVNDPKFTAHSLASSYEFIQIKISGIIYNFPQAALPGGFFEATPLLLWRALHDGAGYIFLCVQYRGRHFFYDWTVSGLLFGHFSFPSSSWRFFWLWKIKSTLF